MEIPGLDPVCFVTSNEQRVPYSIGVSGGHAVSVVLLSNRQNKLLLQRDAEVERKIRFVDEPQVVGLTGAAKGKLILWKCTVVSMDFNENKSGPAVFALGLVREEEIIAQSECFFVVSHSNHRKKGKLRDWVKENVGSLVQNFHFGKNIAIIFEQKLQVEHKLLQTEQKLLQTEQKLLEAEHENEKKLHTCEELAKIAWCKEALPQCCIDYVEAHPEEIFYFSTRLSYDQSDSVFDFELPDFPDDIILTPPSNKLGVAGNESNLDPLLMLQRNTIWGFAGYSPSLGMFSVLIESVIGLDLVNEAAIDISLRLIDPDRCEKFNTSTRLDPSSKKLREPSVLLPRPDKLGVYVLDIFYGKEVLTVTYKVIQKD